MPRLHALAIPYKAELRCFRPYWRPGKSEGLHVLSEKRGVGPYIYSTSWAAAACVLDGNTVETAATYGGVCGFT